MLPMVVVGNFKKKASLPFYSSTEIILDFDSSKLLLIV